MTVLSKILSRIWRLPPTTASVRVHAGIRVPMRDGCSLLADLYESDAPGAPTVLMRSPYGRRIFPAGLYARLLAERGYHVLVQSCRGTHGSEGEFHAFIQEKDDGLDTVAWIESQPWYSGRLGTFGASYLGYVQWAIAAELGPRLSAMALAVTLSDFREEIQSGGGLTLAGALSWTKLVLAPPSGLIGTLIDSLRGNLKRLCNHLPLGEVDRLAVGRDCVFWQEWISRFSAADPYWEQLDFHRTIHLITAPITLVAGWSDIFLRPQLRDFARLQAGKHACRLQIGQWNHVSAATQSAPLLDALDWFDVHLKGKPAGPRKSAVRLWVNGAEEWRDYPAWPLQDEGLTDLHLLEGGKLEPSASPQTGSTGFVYDPADPTPSLFGAVMSGPPRGDMRLLAARTDVLCFRGAPFATDTEMIGRVFATLRVRASVPHHDLFVCLCDLSGDGVMTNVSDGYVRLRPEDAESSVDSSRGVSIECWPIVLYSDEGMTNSAPFEVLSGQRCMIDFCRV